MTLLETLPVELLYEIQLYARSPALPILCRQLHAIFCIAPSSFRAHFLLAHVDDSNVHLADALSKALRFPLCDINVLNALLRAWPEQQQKGIQTGGGDQLASAPLPPPDLTTPSSAETEAGATAVAPVSISATRYVQLPRRLFRSLVPATADTAYHGPYTASSPPLPLLRRLFALPSHPDPNGDDGYALARAVHAEHVPLIRFLLARGASPAHKDCLAVLIAIRRKKLELVRMLIERVPDEDEDGEEYEDAAEGGNGDGHADRKAAGRRKRRRKIRTSHKRRRLADRVEATPAMLRAAVKAKARDIAEYLMQEKGVVPDMQTLQMLMR